MLLARYILSCGTMLQLALMHNQLSGWNSNRARGENDLCECTKPAKTGRLAKDLSFGYRKQICVMSRMYMYIYIFTYANIRIHLKTPRGSKLRSSSFGRTCPLSKVAVCDKRRQTKTNAVFLDQLYIFSAIQVDEQRPFFVFIYLYIYIYISLYILNIYV